jgi:E3 ubiquitin-protein ligase BRE1
MQLNSQLSEKERRITELSKRQLSDKDASKLESSQSTLLQLKTSQNSVAELQSKLSKTEEKWAQALGNEKAALAAVDELISKFNKRWSEFTNHSATIDDNAADGSSGEGKIIMSVPEDNPQVAMSKQIAELQHKLNQALENVRQSETTRENLKVALAMNGSLQAKLDEVKSKYAAVQASRSYSSNSASNRPTQGSLQNAVDACAPPNLSATPKEKEGLTPAAAEQRPNAENSGGGSSSRSEKLHRDYRRARKDLAAMTASREAAKAKFERAERERDTLMESNVRLLKQIGEKDEMNAKSLSTILHLKSMTEKLMEERDNMEHQVKSASQLALAARLATNAKERVSEEVLREKKAVDDRLLELEQQYQVAQIELERVSAEWSDASGKMAVKESELHNALKRSDELVTENEQKREEIRKLMHVVNIAERETQEAKEKLASAMNSGVAVGGEMLGGSSGGTSSFSVDQLKTQISVLKNRLACPVCHYRDKECIILRCRHMHCKQCVDERISNRSRKCPTCNAKFSENEIGDIWLN